MSLEPGRQLVWIGDLFIDERAPMALCAPHVARVSVPAGWNVNDVRDDAPAFWRPTDVVVDETPACPAPQRRTRRRWSSGKMAAIPGLFDAIPEDVAVSAAMSIDTVTPFETVRDDEPVAQPDVPAILVSTVPTLVPAETAPKQSLEGLTAMYGSTAESTDEPDPEEELIDALLAAETPLLARAFRNARAS